MSETGKLYIVATPIGNLGDITLRALEILKSVDVILCEDTRNTRNLLNNFNIKKPLVSYHQHSTESKVEEIEKMLIKGKNLALVTDAGTPGISDPGNKLVASVIARSSRDEAISGSQQSQDGREIAASSRKCEVLRNDIVVSIPGASALITALSVSGFPTDKFLFLGFPPHKKGRQTFFKEAAKSKYTVVFYESSHRIKKCLDELNGVLCRDAKLCVCRELTKKFETIYRGTIEEILKMNVNEKGEFVVVVNINQSRRAASSIC